MKIEAHRYTDNMYQLFIDDTCVTLVGETPEACYQEYIEKIVAQRGLLTFEEVTDF